MPATGIPRKLQKPRQFCCCMMQERHTPADTARIEIEQPLRYCSSQCRHQVYQAHLLVECLPQVQPRAGSLTHPAGLQAALQPCQHQHSLQHLYPSLWQPSGYVPLRAATPAALHQRSPAPVASWLQPGREPSLQRTRATWQETQHGNINLAACSGMYLPFRSTRMSYRMHACHTVFLLLSLGDSRDWDSHL